MGGVGGPCQELFDLGEKIAEEKKEKLEEEERGIRGCGDRKEGKGGSPPDPTLQTPR